MCRYKLQKKNGPMMRIEIIKKGNMNNKDNDILVYNNTNFNFPGGDIESQKVHLHIHQRKLRKSTTIIQGLADDLDLKKILKHLKKTHKCNGAIKNDKNYGLIIKLQGDLRSEIVNFLVKEEIIGKDLIVVHGY